MATRFFGSLRSAWRRQVPRCAPGNSVPDSGRAVEAIDENSFDAIGRLRVDRRALELLIGLG